MNLIARTTLAVSLMSGTFVSAQAQDSYNPTLLADDLSIIENAAKVPELTTFVEALMASELAGELMDGGQYTVFAPSNAAFESLPAEMLPQLLEPENAPQLARLLRRHISPMPLRSADLDAVTAIGTTNTAESNASGQIGETASNTTNGTDVSGGTVTLETLQADSFLAVEDVGGQIHLQPSSSDQEPAAIVIADIASNNGVIHIINRVMTE